MLFTSLKNYIVHSSLLLAFLRARLYKVPSPRLLLSQCELRVPQRCV